MSRTVAPPSQRTAEPGVVAGDGTGWAHRATVIVFTVTLFLSSGLLFLLEPMFAKMVLPLLGSVPAVWNTSVLFFQAMLLAGYAYAHVTTQWLGPRRQAVLHSMLLLVPLIVLPVAVPSGWVPRGDPVGWLLLVLLVAVGLPFFVVSSTAPLMQRWFAGTGHPAAADPYFLYRASNLGSAVALLGYPILIEPTLRLPDQARAWSMGYLVLIGLSVACGALIWRRRPTAVAIPATEDRLRLADASPPPVLSVARRLRWVALAFVPASLMLGVTSYLTTVVAPVPLLWVIPLALYLFSFVLVFSPSEGTRRQDLLGRALPLLVLPTVLTILLKGAKPIWLLGILHLATFLVAAAVCHGALARDRPPARHLTQFYLWIALGGVLGGIFNALVAPVVFNSLAEYPLALVLACLLRPPPVSRSGSTRNLRLDLLVPAAVGILTLGLVVVVRRSDLSNEVLGRALMFGIPALVVAALLDRPIRFGLGVGAMLVASAIPLGLQTKVLYADRTFFGTHEVVVDGTYHVLTHGTTVHGEQSLDPAHRDDPLTYYTRGGPLGDVFSAYHVGRTSRQVAVVGLGAGSMACYAQPGEAWTFYELDPDVARIAMNPRLFTFLRDCLPRFSLVLGDGRLSLTRAPAHAFGLIAIDAFNSDSIPVHLLTKQAISLYLSKLASGGMLAFHISNNYVDLSPVLADQARNARLVCMVRDDASIAPAEGAAQRFPSEWLVMAREWADLGTLPSDARWHVLKGRAGARVWSDDYSNILSVFNWR
jgi:hypothetical protein